MIAAAALSALTLATVMMLYIEIKNIIALLGLDRTSPIRAGVPDDSSSPGHSPDEELEEQARRKAREQSRREEEEDEEFQEEMEEIRVEKQEDDPE